MWGPFWAWLPITECSYLIFSTTACPLTKLTQQDEDFVWDVEQQRAFEELQQCLISAPIPSYPKDESRNIVDTDASNVGLGGALSQLQDGEERVIAYESKTSSRAQKLYCATKRELLVVVQLVGHTFRHYAAPEDEFTIQTDHSSLHWLESFKEVEGIIGRWLQLLSEFYFTIVHRQGKFHQNADALSRIPRGDVLERIAPTAILTWRVSTG